MKGDSMKKIICAFLAAAALIIAVGTVESNILICIIAIAAMAALGVFGGLDRADD